MSNLDISLEEQETITVSKTPTKAFTADAPTRTTDLAAVDVKELEMFVTVQLAKDHPAITYIWKILEEHWYFFEWREKANELDQAWQNYSLHIGQFRDQELLKTKSFLSQQTVQLTSRSSVSGDRVRQTRRNPENEEHLPRATKYG